MSMCLKEATPVTNIPTDGKLTTSLVSFPPSLPLCLYSPSSPQPLPKALTLHSFLL